MRRDTTMARRLRTLAFGALVCGTLTLIVPGCRFDSEVEGVPSHRVHVRIMDPAPPEADCQVRSRDVAWLLRQNPFGDIGYVTAVLPETAERSADDSLCVYTARPRLRFIDSTVSPWEVLAADEEDWVTECEPDFVDEELDDLGHVLSVEIKGEIVFERGVAGCSVESIDG